MNIFIVSQLGSKPRGQELLSRMSSIGHERGKTVPVVVVDDSFNLPEPSSRDASAEHSRFELEDFRRSPIASGVGADKVAKYLDKVNTRWILIDFGRHDHAMCTDFISKLARYSYLSPKLRHCTLVFSVPAVSLGAYARALNEAFNNLSVGGGAHHRSHQIRNLIMVTHIERVIISLPLPQVLLECIWRMAHFVYRYIRKLT